MHCYLTKNAVAELLGDRRMTMVALKGNLIILYSPYPDILTVAPPSREVDFCVNTLIMGSTDDW